MVMNGFRFVVLASLVGACTTARDERVADSAHAVLPPTAAPPSPRSWEARYKGIGPVDVGASVAELSAALGVTLARADSLDPNCDYLRHAEVIPGVWFMIVQGQVARIDVDSAGPPTTEGV